MGNLGYPIPDEINPDNSKCVTIRIPDSPGHARAFWGNFFKLTRWYSWERDNDKQGKDAANVWTKVFAESRDIYDATNGDCTEIPYRELTPEQITEYIEQFILTGGEYACCEEPENNDIMSTIVHIQGRAFLQEICPCGETQFYPLEPADVTLDAGTGIAKIDAPSSKDVPADPWAFTTEVDYRDCYAARATSIILERASNFYEDFANYWLQAADAAFLILDEVYDVAQALSAALRGEIAEPWYGQEPSEAANNIESLASYNALIGAWSWNGTISRSDLRLFVSYAPDDVNGTAVKHILQDWANYANISALNDALQVASATCTSEDGAVPDPPSDLRYLYEYGGDNYYVWDETVNEQMSSTGQANGITLFPTIPGDHALMESVAIVGSTASNCEMGLQPSTDDEYSRTLIGASWPEAWIYRAVDANHQQIMKEILNPGIQELTQQGFVSGVAPAAPTVWKRDGSGIVVTVTRFIAVAGPIL